MVNEELKTKGLVTFSLVLFCLATPYFFTLPAYKNFTAKRVALQRAQTEQVQLKTTKERTQSFLDEYQNLKAQAQTVELALPREQQVPTLLGSLEALAIQSGLNLGGVNVNEVVESDPTKKPQPLSVVPLKLRLTVSGPYPSLKDFLLRLESHLRILDVEAVNFDIEDPNSIQYQISMTAYYQK